MNLNKLDKDNITPTTKLRILNYLISEKCVCGKSKSKKFWLCNSCYEKRDVELHEKHRAACAEHIKLTIDILNSAKND